MYPDDKQEFIGRTNYVDLGKAIQQYRNGEIDFQTEDDYVELVCDFLEYLPTETTIHRLAGNGLSSTLIEPQWLGKKFDCLNKIDRTFEQRGTWQGCKS